MALDADEILIGLQALVPAAVVEARPETDVAGVVPAACIRPTSVDEVRKIVGWAATRGMALAAVGGMSTLGVGNPPSRLDLLIDMNGLDSITEYDAQDLVLTAQAGVTIQKVQELVNEDSLVMPLDPQSTDRATMGGVVACADHGPRRRHYGGLRDIVLGLKAVLPDGNLVSFGGRTLKNVAGYDVGKIFIGSLGMIGVIVEVTVRLLPLPASEELLLIGVPDLETAHRLASRILDSPLVPAALELTSPTCTALLPPGTSAASESGYLMLIALEGHPADVERQVRDVSGFCSELELLNTKVHRAADAGVTPSEAWTAYNEVRRRSLATPSCAAFRCTVPLDPLWGVARAVEDQCASHSLDASYRMSCGTGSLEVYAAGSETELRAFAQSVRAEAEHRRGALSVLDGWAALGRGFDAWGTHRSDFGLMQAVKQKFDPEGIMNPGRFAGGL